MKKKLIIYNIVMAVIVLALMFGFGIMITNGNNHDIAEKKIKEITAIYVANYDGITFPDDSDVRITIIDATGKVIKDNGMEEIEETHLYRDEIKAAATGHPAVVIRRSETLGKEMMYYAQAVKDETGETIAYVRVAIPTEDIRAYAVKTIIPTVIILLGVWICSAVVSILLSGVLLKPLKQVKDGLTQIESGKYQKIAPTTGDDDINEILVGINDLSERLQQNMLSANQEKQKLDYILSNISDGIAVFDGGLNIVIANASLKEIFGVTEVVGKSVDVLTADAAFINAVRESASKKSDTIFTFKTNSRYYLCSVRFTDNDLIIAVLTDVTQEKNSEKMRLEFFANASHELKTPLTAIKGFNDMVSLQAKEQPILDYSARIGKEIDRVINLLGDMLDLSKFENSGVKSENVVSVELAEIASEVKESLARTAGERNVAINITGRGTVDAEREHVYELVKNLTENGVRYNNDGGKVEIKIEDERGKIKLTVSDDGIGIDQKHQSRIFERFYRVDKSRSRATGGTGLGLAIVKHICELYNAELTLKSKLGVGTTVTVVFKKG